MPVPATNARFNFMPKLMETNDWFGFKHDAVDKAFTGGLTYLNTFSIKGCTWAVYSVKKPDRSKKHKDYLLLRTSINALTLKTNLIVAGISKKDMANEKAQDCVLCEKCDYVIFSRNRHDFVTCLCKSCFIDGGKDYLRTDAPMRQIFLLDLLSHKIWMRNKWVSLELYTKKPSKRRKKKSL